MTAKCGPLKIWHWAHKTLRGCTWAKPETPWHRAWKARFPDDWQEVSLQDDAGTRHRADVKTAHGWVLEFQHSSISEDDRRSREAFHSRLIWLIDGARQQHLKARFERARERGTPRCPEVAVGKEAAEGALLRTWVLSATHVLFDFGDFEELWWLSPASDRAWAYVEPLSLSTFMAIHTSQMDSEARTFDLLAQDFGQRVAQAKDC